jgi:hypothetical protein
MKIVFLLLMLMSAPNQPSIKYNGIVYITEEECIVAKNEYMDIYNDNREKYKNKLIIKAYCIPFDAFPLIKTKGTGA